MITKSRLEYAAKTATSYREMVRLLNSNGYTVRRLVREHGVDVKHFTFGKVYTSCVGRTFGRLTVTEVFKEQRKWRARCSCSCGASEVVRRIDSVLSGKVISCGCTSRNRPAMQGSGNPSFKGCGDLRSAYVQEVRRSAKRRGLIYSLTKEFLWKLFKAQDRKCALSGLPIAFGRVDYPHETTASLDRVDSAGGYTKDNVQWVHKDINKMKQAFPQERFIELCLLVARLQGCKQKPERCLEFPQ